MENNKGKLEGLIKNLCILIHTECSSISDESNSEELGKVLSLSSLDALDFISETINEAIEAKKTAKDGSQYMDFLEDEGYQKEMQKLESEIRNHIKIEQQMKLFADALEEKSTQLESHLNHVKKQSTSKIETMKSEAKTLKSQIISLNKEIAELKKESETSSKESNNGKIKELGKSNEIDKKIARAEIEHAKVARSLNETEKEYVQQKKDNEELKCMLREFVGANVEESKEKGLIYKAKYEEKCLELELIKKKARGGEKGGRKQVARSVTPTLAKGIHVQSQKVMKKVPSNERIRLVRGERIINKQENSEKKRLPMSFTARK
jgi:hypothetical protein